MQMSIRKMKLMIKRTALGNIFAVVTCGSLILLYFCLLRYNTHNTYFDIRPHEIRKRYIRGEPLQIKVPWKKLLHSNIYRGKGGNWTRRPGPNSPLSLFVVEEHHEGLSIIIQLKHANLNSISYLYLLIY